MGTINAAQKQILLVEDEGEFRKMLVTKLQRNSYNVIECSSIKEAVLKMPNQKFDLFVFDIRLGDGTSDIIINSVKNDKKDINHETPVLVISGHLDKNFLVKVKGRINGAMVKPFPEGEFLDKVKSLI